MFYSCQSCMLALFFSSYKPLMFGVLSFTVVFLSRVYWFVYIRQRGFCSDSDKEVCIWLYQHVDMTSAFWWPAKHWTKVFFYIQIIGRLIYCIIWGRWSLVSMHRIKNKNVWCLSCNLLIVHIFFLYIIKVICEIIKKISQDAVYKWGR